MDVLVFYYTLIVMFIVAFAAASCAAGFLVSRRKSFAFGASALSFYFFDISVVFFHNFVFNDAAAPAYSPYEIQFPALSVLFGAGAIGSFWLYVCEKLGKDPFKNKDYLTAVAPVAIFVALSVAAYALVPDGRLKCLLFFSVRQVFVIFAIAVYFTRYFRTSAAERHKIRPKPIDMAIAFLLAVGVFIEDVVVIYPLQNSSRTAARSPSRSLPNETSSRTSFSFMWAS